MTKNALFYGDNLDVLKHYVKDESVDLVYLDPPFNSNADYNMLFAEQDGTLAEAQIKAFQDSWRWDQVAAFAYHDIVENGPSRVSQTMIAFRTLLGESNMLAYLAMMAPRLVELHRVLKPMGSIYLHCDPTASHYLKLLMDAVFGPEHYCNEIVWKRGHGHNSAKRYGANHDVILFYSKSANMTWNPVYQEYDPEYIEKHYRHVDSEGRRYKHENPTGAGLRYGVTGKPWRGIDPSAKGRHWAKTHEEMERLDAQGLIHWPKKEGGWPYIKTFLDSMKGTAAQEVWADINPINMMAAERLGYPTQKPEALLERIVRASSNEWDTVLDPFCGCGTTVSVAQRLDRRWIGIDITHLAITLIKSRLYDSYGPSITSSYKVLGEPTTIHDAQALAEEKDRYQFQYWALNLVQARPLQSEQKKGADKGIDGRLYFHDDAETNKTKQVVFSVKSGHLKPDDIRALSHVLEREKADIGVLLTMEVPTQPMRKDAASVGFYTSPWGTTHPRLQILTIAELLEGKRIDMPPSRDLRTFRRAPKAKKGSDTTPLALDFGDDE